MRTSHGFRRLILRLGLAWIGLSVVFGIASYQLELRKIHNFVVAMASEGIQREIGEHPDLLNPMTSDEREKHREILAELTQHIFVAVELYDAAKNLILIQSRSGAATPPEQPIADHHFPERGDVKFQPFYFDQTPHLRMILPVHDRRGATSGYLEGIFRIDGLTNRQVRLQVIWTLAGVTLVILATMIVMFPIFRHTERRLEAYARSLEESHRDLLDANAVSRGKSSFIATLSHEFRTPLNAIMGFSDLKRNEVFGPHSHPKYKEYAEDIYQSALHLRDLVNDILDLAKAEAGKLELREERADLADIVRACLRLTQPQAKAGGCAIVTTLPERLPLLWIDRRKITQVLLNLISNAVKFSPAGGKVTVSARLEGNGDVTVAVTDAGIGIKPEDISMVLEEFHQTDAARTKAEGTGLGLPIARRLIELHGGTLDIASTPGQGTTVSLRLPSSRTRWAMAQPAAE